MRTNLFRVAVTATALLALTACGGNGDGGGGGQTGAAGGLTGQGSGDTCTISSTIPVGAALSLTGAAGSYGTSQQKGLQLAAEQLNAKGGVKYDVKIEDDQTDPRQGITVFEGFVNGERKQASNTNQLIFSIERLVEFVSNVMTLNPGDVITTGTPSGVGPLKAGDRITIRIEGVGELSNPVTARD